MVDLVEEAHASVCNMQNPGRLIRIPLAYTSRPRHKISIGWDLDNRFRYGLFEEFSLINQKIIHIELIVRISAIGADRLM